MNKNRIVVFNRLTESELADCSMFEELLENHYHKFVFFYTIMSDSDLLQHVDQISCKPVNKQELDIIITLDGIYMINTIAIFPSTKGTVLLLYINYKLIRGG